MAAPNVVLERAAIALHRIGDEIDKIRPVLDAQPSAASRLDTARRRARVVITEALDAMP